MVPYKKRSGHLLLWTALALLSACAPKPAPLVVGSKAFTEQSILGEIAAQHIERQLGIVVERRLNLGATPMVHDALVNGAIDLYPEYTGAALTTILRMPAAPNPRAVFERVRLEYRKLDIEWLEPLGFDNAYVIAVRPEDAAAHRLASISDLTHTDGRWRLGVDPEFIERPDGFKALNRAYNIPWGAGPLTLDPNTMLRALADKQLSIVAAQSTDGMFLEIRATLLKDDLNCFPPLEAAIAVRRGALRRHPGLEKILRRLSGKIDADTMRRLNYQVDVRKLTPAAVASQFLMEVKP